MDFVFICFQVLEVLKKCILSISNIQKLGEVVRDILLGDSSIHSALFRLVCTTSDDLEVNLAALEYANKLLMCSECSASMQDQQLITLLYVLKINSINHFLCFMFYLHLQQKLYFSRLYGLTEIEGLQQAIVLGLDILSSMLSDLSRVCFINFSQLASLTLNFFEGLHDLEGSSLFFYPGAPFFSTSGLIKTISFSSFTNYLISMGIEMLEKFILG